MGHENLVVSLGGRRLLVRGEDTGRGLAAGR